LDHLAPRHKRAPKFISTFAGCGGSSLGYSMAGFRELLAVEWDANAIETFKLNFPGVDTFLGDIKQLSLEEVFERTGLAPGELDVFDGSPPCQGFSTAGKRKFHDSRNQLFREYVRLLKGLQPKAFIMENVSGMVKGKMRVIFSEILRELKACGYKVVARLMNAMYFGVPQSRNRMIFVGVREDLAVDPSHPLAMTRPMQLWEAISDLPLAVQNQDIDHIWIDELEKQTKWIGRAARLKPGEKVAPGTASSRRAVMTRPLETIQSCRPGSASYVRNCTVHPSQPRTLSVREMARCQSFPDEFRFVDPMKFGRYRIGNSVPPLFMRAIAEHIRSAILEPYAARHAA
jgi:DNA (cytosine-5)-methyltransferase 1